VVSLGKFVKDFEFKAFAIASYISIIFIHILVV
jgi:hypothetical protein